MKELSRQEEALHFFYKAYRCQMDSSYDKAIVCYKKSIELHPTAEAYTFLGWTYSFMNRLDQAIDECKKAISIDPDFGNPYNDIGVYLIEKGWLDDAVRYLSKAIHAKRYSHHCFPHYNLGRVWEKKGDLTKAMKSYRKSLHMNPKYTPANLALRKLEGMLN